MPAVLEQGLKSDLPGDLVAANVYDTATGQFLLIFQGARLIGRYDSHVSYGQSGVQVGVATPTIITAIKFQRH
jgi:type IV secretion system protein TrbI